MTTPTLTKHTHHCPVCEADVTSVTREIPMYVEYERAGYEPWDCCPDCGYELSWEHALPTETTPAIIAWDDDDDF
jgi:uncharacterized protein with PIN domain